jgi:hypothetical protein
MTDIELEALPMDKQVAYWKGRMLIAIGEGKLDSEFYFMLDLMLRIGYQRGLNDAREDARKAKHA